MRKSLCSCRDTLEQQRAIVEELTADEARIAGRVAALKAESGSATLSALQVRRRSRQQWPVPSASACPGLRRVATGSCPNPCPASFWLL